MTHSPPGRRGPRSRRAGGPEPEKWLELPGWRKPLDTLLVLAVTFSAAWLALVVIPAAAHVDRTPVAEAAPETVSPTDATVAGPTADPGQWMAGPVYTGAPGAPTTEAAVVPAQDVVAAPVHRAPATTRAPAPRKTSSAPKAVPRTTAAPKTSAAPVVAAAATTPTVVQTTPTTPTTSETPTSTSTTPTTTSPTSSETTTSSPTTTTSSPTTTSETTTTAPPP